jgi:nucleoid-associated protein YgaU
MFFKGSRYESIADAIHVEPDGREIPYKRLRILTSPPVHQAHVVALGDRLDRIASQHYGDPEQFWRIGDANQALQPESLTEALSRRLGIPLI